MARLARPARPLSVLVVDPSRDAADTLAEVLQTLGHEAWPAYTPEAALRAVAANPPDAVLLDVGLCPSAGSELARRLVRASGRKPLLVALSGYAREADKAACRRGGFDHVVLEPYDPVELTALLGRHAGQAG